MPELGILEQLAQFKINTDNFDDSCKTIKISFDMTPNYKRQIVLEYTTYEGEDKIMFVDRDWFIEDIDVLIEHTPVYEPDEI